MNKLIIYNKLNAECDEEDLQVITYYGVKGFEWVNKTDTDNGFWLRIYFEKGTKNYKEFGKYLLSDFDPKRETFVLKKCNKDIGNKNKFIKYATFDDSWLVRYDE